MVESQLGVVDITEEIIMDCPTCNGTGEIKKITKNRLKQLIIRELQTSKEPVHPGSIAIKYKIPYLQVEAATKELKEEGVLDVI